MHATPALGLTLPDGTRLDVDALTGQATLLETDARLPLGLALRRARTSADAPGLFGRGWRSEVDATLHTLEQGRVAVRRVEGVVLYAPVREDLWVSTLGEVAWLVRTPEGWEVRDPAGRLHRFDPQGRLVELLPGFRLEREGDALRLVGGVATLPPRHRLAHLEPTDREVADWRRRGRQDAADALISEARAAWYHEQSPATREVILGENAAMRRLGVDTEGKKVDGVAVRHDGTLVPFEVKNQKEIHLSESEGNHAFGKFRYVARNGDMSRISHFEVIAHTDSQLPKNHRVDAQGWVEVLTAGLDGPEWNPEVIGGKRVRIVRAHLGRISIDQEECHGVRTDRALRRAHHPSEAPDRRAAPGAAGRPRGPHDRTLAPPSRPLDAAMGRGGQIQRRRA